MRIEQLLAAGASIKGTARKFEINPYALRRHWINHVSVEARAAYIAGAGVAKDQLEAVVADESLALIDHYRIVRGSLYKGFGAASEGCRHSVRAHWGCRRSEIPSQSLQLIVQNCGAVMAVFNLTQLALENRGRPWIFCDQWTDYSASKAQRRRPMVVVVKGPRLWAEVERSGKWARAARTWR
jgi:hypothetical protein